MTIDAAVIDRATGLIDLAVWRQRITIGHSVGRCRCGGPLEPGEPDQDRRVTWLPCTCASCGHSSALIAERPVKGYART